MYATLDFNAHSLVVEETIRYYNATGQALTDIVLSVQPNLWNNAFLLNTVTQDNVALTNYSLNGQRLTLNLLQSLQSGAATTFVINYSLTIPAKRSDAIFGYDSNMLNLVEWYPMIVPFSILFMILQISKSISRQSATEWLLPRAHPPNQTAIGRVIAFTAHARSRCQPVMNSFSRNQLSGRM
jgi:hypothetical protein